MHVRVEALGNTFRAFIDGEYAGEIEMEGYEKGSFGFAHLLTEDSPPARYDNLVVYPLAAPGVTGPDSALN